MIKLALYLLLYMIPALALGYIILLIFPHIPMPLLILLNMGIIVGLFLMYKNKNARELRADNRMHEMPDWLASKTVLFFLILATFLASIFIFSENKTDLYVDNASDYDIDVKISHNGKHTIKAGKYVKLEVVKGDIEVEYNGKKKQYTISENGNWILNIDKLNSYLRTTVSYSTSRGFFDSDKNSRQHESPAVSVINYEFFNAKVDYVFDIPEKIKIRKSRFSFDSDVQKTVLYRSNEYGFSTDAADTNEPGGDKPGKQVNTGDTSDIKIATREVPQKKAPEKIRIKKNDN